jgi:hypothetical protein
MFAASHMAAGAFIESRMRKRIPTALISVAVHPLLDLIPLWHAPYPWPAGYPVILGVVPYPQDPLSTFALVSLVTSAVVVAVLLRRYWWGMLWALSPDIVDWLILRPLTGRYIIHHVFPTPDDWGPWSFGLEMLFIVTVAALVYLSIKKQKTAPAPTQ